MVSSLFKRRNLGRGGVRNSLFIRVPAQGQAGELGVYWAEPPILATVLQLLRLLQVVTNCYRVTVVTLVTDVTVVTRGVNGRG